MKELDGFTLAEVLITLGIIGVVAALILPAVINNIMHKELETGLKEGYSILQQGLARMSADLGVTVTSNEYSVGDGDPGNFYKDYVKYFNILYDCGVSNPDPSICMSRASNINEDTDFYNDLSYKTFNGNKVFSNVFDDGQFVLQNGMLVMIENPNQASNSNIFISIDVNGKKKRPNKLGYDVFSFKLMSDGKLLPMGMKETDYNNENTYCSKTSTSNVNGIGCASKALSDPNYFKNLP